MLCLVALAHAALTASIYRAWSAQAAWFLDAGLGLPLLGLLNLSHIGIAPCQQPTARLVRWANWGFLVFGVATLLAVPEARAFIIVAALLAQAVAAHRTLPGPA